MRIFTISYLLLNSYVLWGDETILFSQCNFKHDISNPSNCSDINDHVKKTYDYGEWNSNKDNEKIQNFIRSLSQEQKTVLDQFFRAFVKSDHKNSYIGYVLFGDKPLCIKGLPLDTLAIDLPGISQDGTFVKWLELWQNLGVSPENKEYFFVHFDVDYGYHHLICINRRAFLRAVNANLSLFRYALGPTLTAEELLKELIQAKEDFYTVIKNDNVLLGILLGYGRQNALLVSREELISDAFSIDRTEDFPYTAKPLRFQQTKLANRHAKHLSLGYRSLADEVKALKKQVVTSTHLKPFKFCQIPHFGCEPDSQETQILLDTYTKNRSTIIDMLASDNFLEETLKKLFTTTSKELDIPKIPKGHTSSLAKDKEALARQLVDLIYQDIESSKDYCQQSCLKAYFEGIQASQKGQSSSEIFANIKNSAMEMYQIEHGLKRAKNLETSDAYFRALASQKEFISLVPGKVYYKVLRHGLGPSLSPKVHHVSFHYTYQVLHEADTVKDAGTVKEESLEYLIPGIALALIGMQKGEAREIYLHPEYGYGENTYLPPNTTLVAKIELLDFSEGEREAIISPAHQLERKKFDELLNKYEKFCYEECYGQGVDIWNSVKKANLVDFETFEKCFNHLLLKKGQGMNSQ